MVKVIQGFVLAFALGSVLASVVLLFAGLVTYALFVGLWPTTLLILYLVIRDQ